MATVGNLVVNLKANSADFGKNLKKARKSLRTFGKAIKRSSERAAKWSRNILMAGAAAAAVFVKLAMEQERAEMALDAALQATGQSLALHGKALRKVAADIQTVTVHGDEFILGLMTAGMNLGINADKIGGVTKQALGLATVLKMDLNTAMRYMVLAQQGEMTMLRRYLPALRATEDATEQLAIVTEAANRGWQQAQAEARTTVGRLTQLKNALGDVGEKIGMTLLPMIRKATSKLQAFGGWMQALSKGQIRDLVDDAKKLGLVLVGIWAAPALVGAVTGFIGLLKAATGAMVAFKMSAVLAGSITAGLAIGLLAVGAGYADIAIRAAKARWAMFQISLESRETGKLLRELGRAQRELNRSMDPSEKEGALQRVIALRERLIELSDDQIRVAEEEAEAVNKITAAKVALMLLRAPKAGGVEAAAEEAALVARAELERIKTQEDTARALNAKMQRGLGDLINRLKDWRGIQKTEKEEGAKREVDEATRRALEAGATKEKQDKELSLSRERNRLLRRGPALG